VDDRELKFIEELNTIQASGVPFHVERWNEDKQMVVMLGPSISEPLAMIVTDDLARAMFWLREKVKEHYPHCAYSRRLLIN
jgi:hypothetical protein